MVKRAPSGPGWSASSLPAGCPLPLRPRPTTAAAAAPSAPGSSAREGVSREGVASSGPRPAAPGGSRSPGVSGARPSAGRARISCRGSRAPGAAPSDRTTRARGRGRRRRSRAFEVCGASAGSPPAAAPRWLRPDCGMGASRRAPPAGGLTTPAPPELLGPGPEPLGDPFSESVSAALFRLPFLCFWVATGT